MLLKNTANGATILGSWHILEMLGRRGSYLIETVDSDIPITITQAPNTNEEMSSFYDGEEVDTVLFHQLANEIMSDIKRTDFESFVNVLITRANELKKHIKFLGLKRPASVYFVVNNNSFKVWFNQD